MLKHGFKLFKPCNEKAWCTLRNRSKSRHNDTRLERVLLLLYLAAQAGLVLCAFSLLSTTAGMGGWGSSTEEHLMCTCSCS